MSELCVTGEALETNMQALQGSNICCHYFYFILDSCLVLTSAQWRGGKQALFFRPSFNYCPVEGRETRHCSSACKDWII